ncbi:hypothetical protein C8Q77DRAFT_1137637 [Trametes polyzona]|nr:hypothetical protein C8Q77DRAFT_1137637 [Trametes polyzona]
MAHDSTPDPSHSDASVKSSCLPGLFDNIRGLALPWFKVKAVDNVLRRTTLEKADLLHVFDGVRFVVNSTQGDNHGEPVKQWLDSVPALSLPVGEWRTKAIKGLKKDDGLSRNFFDLVLGVALLRHHSRSTSTRSAIKDRETDPALLELIWELVRTALTGPSPVDLPPLRSAQGFLSIALCHHNKEGNIEELFRLHVWLPDGQRGDQEFVIHTHQPWARSWIMAGKATDHRFDVEELEEGDTRTPTHETMRMDWGKGHQYTTDQKLSLARADGAGKLVFTTERLADKETHGLDDSYCVPTMDYHYTQAPFHEVHTTLFFFDSSLGFTQNAPILGPVGASLHPQPRDPMGNSTVGLVDVAHAVRSLDMLKRAKGTAHKEHVWNHARKAISDAIYTCGALRGALVGEPAYLYLCLDEPWKDTGRVGTYDGAPQILEELLKKITPSTGPRWLHTALQGELGSIYRQMGRLDSAKRAFRTQYEWARGSDPKNPRWARGVYHAARELGVVNFLLSQTSKNSTALLAEAIKNLQESVEGVRSLKLVAEGVAKDLKQEEEKKAAELAHKVELARREAEKSGIPMEDPQNSSPNQAQIQVEEPSIIKLQQLHAWEALGQARLAQCYAARGDRVEAVTRAKESLELAGELLDGTTRAFVRVLARAALRKAGEPLEGEEPLASPAVTPAIALCKYPSKEHLGYLEELLPNHAQLDVVDERRYSALDYAVASGDKAMEALVTQALEQALPQDAVLKLLGDARQKAAAIDQGGGAAT